MTRPPPHGCIRRPSACHDLPEMHCADEPEPPAPKAWWVDEPGGDSDEREPYPEEGSER